MFGVDSKVEVLVTDGRQSYLVFVCKAVVYRSSIGCRLYTVCMRALKSTTGGVGSVVVNCMGLEFGAVACLSNAPLSSNTTSKAGLTPCWIYSGHDDDCQQGGVLTVDVKGFASAMGNRC